MARGKNDEGAGEVGRREGGMEEGREERIREGIILVMEVSEGNG